MNTLLSSLARRFSSITWTLPRSRFVHSPAEIVSATWSRCDRVKYDQVNGEYALRAKEDIVENGRIAMHLFFDLALKPAVP